MALHKVDLNLFLVFDTIYSERNLTRAARVLSITQPAVSNALSRLRRLFNDELFVRGARGMVPTAVADNLAPSVSQALGLLEAGIMDRGDFDPAHSTRLFQFSMSDLAEAVILPRLMPYFESHAPGLALQSYPVARRDLLQQLSRSEIDFAVDVPVIENEKLKHQSLISDQLVCAVRPEHPLVSGELSMEQYLALGHVHVSSRKRGGGQVDLALQELGAERQIKLRVQHYRVAAHIVADTDLVLTIPGFLAAQYDLKLLKLPFKVPPVDLHLYWHSKAGHDPAHRWLRETLFSLFG